MNGIDRLAERLLHEVKAAQGKLDEKDPAGAETLLRKIIAEAAKGGIRSAHATWLLAIAHDYQGELEAAFEAITRAVALDPLEPAARNSWDVIVGRIAGALTADGRDTDDPSTPRLYRLLQRAGRIPLGAHLAMARYHEATGAAAEAARIVEATTLLHPAEPAAWRAKAALARRMGDEAAASEAEAMAAAAAPDEAPFGVPGLAEA